MTPVTREDPRPHKFCILRLMPLPYAASDMLPQADWRGQGLNSQELVISGVGVLRYEKTGHFHRAFGVRSNLSASL
jgi:hypothetical protein